MISAQAASALFVCSPIQSKIILIMFKNILNLDGVRKLDKNAQAQVNGGRDPNNPCGTGPMVVIHGKTEAGCNGPNMYWYRNRCLHCYGA